MVSTVEDLRITADLGLKRALKVGDASDIAYWRDRVKFWKFYEETLVNKE